MIYRLLGFCRRCRCAGSNYQRTQSHGRGSDLGSAVVAHCQQLILQLLRPRQTLSKSMMGRRLAAFRSRFPPRAAVSSESQTSPPGPGQEKSFQPVPGTVSLLDDLKAHSLPLTLRRLDNASDSLREGLLGSHIPNKAIVSLI